MESDQFVCECLEKFLLTKEELIVSHLSNCLKWKNISPFYKIISRINLQKLTLIENQVIQTEFGLCGFQSKLIENYQEVPSLIKTSSLSSSKPNVMQVCYEDMVQCDKCEQRFYSFDTEQFWYLQNCCHCICRLCLIKLVNQNYIKNKGQVNCPKINCNSPLIDYDIKIIVGKEKLELLNSQLLELEYNIVTCVKCKEKFEFLKGKEDPNTKDEKGRKLTRDQLKNYVENRFTCLNSKCKTEQCKSCKSTPYHLGFTCDEWSRNMKATKCRFCESVIQNVDAKKLKALQNICHSEDCQKRAKNCCIKIHPCGHPCSGVLNEINCLSCLDDECAEKNSQMLMNQKGSDYCRICYVEGLGNAPSIKIDCGHIFHYECLTKRLEMKWTRPRISFNFCLCPLCKNWMDFPVENRLHELMSSNKITFEDIKKKSMDRLKHEERDKDERLKTIGDPFYNRPIEYAMTIYSYYECFKCKVAYFGGLKKCEDLLEEEKKTEDFKPSELVCANCCDIPIENCKKHGTDFIEFKCKFCCSIANWFCWGNTHFCEKCHQKATDVAKTPKSKLPKCPGPNDCPLKVKHKDNGDECALGCALCRNIKENYKKF